MPIEGYWNPQRIDRMQSLVREGKSAGHIADALAAEFHEPISRNAVLGKIYRMARLDPKAPLLEKRVTVAMDRSKSQKKASSGDGARPTRGGREGHPPAAVTRKAERAAEIRAQREQQAQRRRDLLAAAALPVQSLGVTLVELNSTDCKFPLDGPTGELQRFCGLRRDDGSPYCPHHRGRATASRADIAAFEKDFA